MHRPILILIFLTLLSSGIQANTAAYDYPIADPLAATVVGTPSEYRAVVERDIPRKQKKIVIFPERKVPGIVVRSELLYSLAAQTVPSPLIFVIAGTGSSYHSAKMKLLEAAFYAKGFHVVSLSSPTYSNFIVTASSTHIPGRTSEDAADLYRVMKAIWEEQRQRLEVTDFYVTGYSLGGTNAAFVTKLDERQRVFNFKKVLLINPPVNLYNSVGILDAMLDRNIPGPVAPDFNTFLERVIKRFTEVYSRNDDLNFNDEFLYRIYEEGVDAQKPPAKANLEAIIGAAFRISSANMLATADFVAQRGFVVPRNHQFRVSESTTPYFKVAARTSFIDYFNDMYVPYFLEKDPASSRTSLIRESSLESIEPYLRGAEKIGVVHNADDIILAPGEIDYFRQVFGSRAKIYPRGGHCGNLEHRDNLAYITGFFKN